MGGQALTATELAYCANVSRSTASGHLSKLVAAAFDYHSQPPLREFGNRNMARRRNNYPGFEPDAEYDVSAAPLSWLLVRNDK
jgi:hypothetical protein